ncbi:hypothetical protein AVEN_250019-1, partial [Araneus ventricosus]
VADHNILNKRIKCRQAVQKDLRDMFRSEYLGQLVQRSTSKESRPFPIGDIILVGSDNLKRIHWPLGPVHSHLDTFHLDTDSMKIISFQSYIEFIEILTGKDKEIRLV